jgi:beta-lactamase regulating signal transducer with metallopeptidase domain
MIAEPLLLLLKTNLAGSAAVGVVLALRFVARRLIGAQAGYRLWLLVPLAVAGSLLPARTLIVQVAPAMSGAIKTFLAPAAGDYSPLLFGIWLVGVALSLIVLAGRQRRFMAGLGLLTATADRRVFSARNSGAGPAVVGMFRPCIILPADFEAQFDAEQRVAIMIHERAHLSAGHIQTNCLVALIRCACWFNPFAHIAAHALRLDQELACDARVLTQFPAGRRAYGEALLRTQLNALPLPLGCYWPSSGVQSLKERLIMLKKPSPNRAARLAGATLVTGLCASITVAAWAAQPDERIAVAAPAKTVQAPDRVSTSPNASAAPAQVSISNAVVRDYAPEARKPAMIVAPNWTSMPDAATMMSVVNATLGPDPQLPDHLPDGSKAVMNCSVGGDGTLNGCNVLNQSNDNIGKVALALAPSFKMQPGLDASGAPIEGAQVNIPILFKWQ